MDDSEVTGLLEQLGLTEYEAKTLSSLFRLKEAEAPDVSTIAQVPKTRVYDVLDKLIKKGLIIEIYGRPKKYRVIDPNDALTGLINKRKNELKKLEEKASSLKNLIYNFESPSKEEGEKIMKVKEKSDFIKILSQEIDNAKKSVIGLTELNQDNILLHDSVKRASNRKVDVKLLSTTKGLNKTDLKSFGEAGVAIREHDHGLNAFIIDDQKLILGLSDFNKDKAEYHFAIWQNHPSMTNLMQSHFQANWKKK